MRVQPDLEAGVVCDDVYVVLAMKNSIAVPDAAVVDDDID